ncbi:MAG: hypothetical protein V4516_17535 [Pseudomonadota bacterium]
MLRPLFWGVLGALASMSPVSADTSVKVSFPYILAATTEAHSYGLWLAAPKAGCRTVRYVVTAEGTRLGFSGPLAPGEGAVVRIGQGFAAGRHALAITAYGCTRPPAATRRVRLAKPSPDHSWLAR